MFCAKKKSENIQEDEFPADLWSMPLHPPLHAHPSLLCLPFGSLQPLRDFSSLLDLVGTSQQAVLGRERGQTDIVTSTHTPQFLGSLAKNTPALKQKHSRKDFITPYQGAISVSLSLLYG